MSHNAPSTTAPLLVDAREAARLLSISTRTLWTMTASGEIPSVKFGRLVRYHLPDLERAIEARKVVRLEA